MKPLDLLKHHVTGAIERGEKEPIVAVVEKARLDCAGSATSNGCKEPCSYIDEKGFIYCAKHGLWRKQYRRCRKLKPSEIKILESGKPLPKY